MKSWSELETRSQSEALINEFKGNLLEYLVGMEISRGYDLEGLYIAQIPELYRDQLSLYEDELRNFDSLLIEKLPLFATATKKEIQGFLPRRVDGVHLLGKATNQKWKDEFHEADLLLVGEGQYTPISLKLCQQGSLVNTKSAGVRTFVESYFAKDGEGQQHLNHLLERSFDQMARELYDYAGLEYTSGFDQQWREAGLSDLPGQLPSAYKPALQQHYHRVIEEIYTTLKALYTHNKEHFMNSLFPLVGIGHQDMVQVKCFHKANIDERYQLSYIEINNRKSWKEAIEQLKFEELKEMVSYFDLSLGDKTLQIRVKPMNVFTVPGLKVNCSVKDKK